MALVEDVALLIQQGNLEALRKVAVGQPINEYDWGRDTRKMVSVGLSALAQKNLPRKLHQDLRDAQLSCIQYLMQCYPLQREEVQDEYHRNVLGHAICTGRLDLVKLIFPHCSELCVERGHMEPALGMIAQAQEGAAIADFLLHHPDVKLSYIKESKEEIKPLLMQFAVHHDNKELVHWLVDQGVDVGGPARVHTHFDFKFGGRTRGDKHERIAFPIYFAVSKSMAEFLESFGAKITAVSPEVGSGQSAMYPAIRFNALPYIKYLLARGLSVHHRDIDGKTPLHCAASGGTYKEVNLLLDAGADVNAIDAKGYTPLLESLEHSKNKARFLALLKRGADVMVRDKSGAHVFFRLNELPLIESILDKVLQTAAAGEPMDKSALHDFACWMTQKKFASLAAKLMACDAFDHSCRGGMNSTPVHEMVKGVKDWDGAGVFIDLAQTKGFDLESKNERGYTALMEAISSKNLSAMRLLLEKGADVRATTPSGTPAYKLPRDAAIKSELYSRLTTDAVTRSVDDSLENGVGEDTLEETQPKRSKASFGML